MYECLWKKKKRLCPFSFVKAKTKEGKHLAVNRQQSGKGSFYNQDEWLREIEEHER